MPTSPKSKGPHGFIDTVLITDRPMAHNLHQALHRAQEDAQR